MLTLALMATLLLQWLVLRDMNAKDEVAALAQRNRGRPASGTPDPHHIFGGQDFERCSLPCSKVPKAVVT